MRKFRTAVIGTGKIGPAHALPLAGLPESEFVAVCSRNTEKAEAFAARYGVKAYTDVARMVRDEGVEAVVIGTPHPAHVEGALPALELGAHVLIEKPLASTLADCDAMIAAARRHGVQLGVISQRRFLGASQRIRAAIDAGKIGRPSLGVVNLLGWRDEAYYRSDPWRGSWDLEGGGVLVNQAPHQLDLLLWYMGPVAEIYGYWGNINHPSVEIEDTAVAVIRFRNGGFGNLVVSNSQKPGLWGKVHVHGSNGASVGVQTDGGAMFIAGVTSVLEPPVNDLWTVPGEESLLAQWQVEDRRAFSEHDGTVWYHRLQIEEFLRAALDGRAPAVTGEDGRAVVELFTGIYRSQRDHAPVQFPLQGETDRNDMDGRKSA